ncbi:unnamed protein product [Clonostachys rosea]|uniref:JmjC domain-containing protein n=1 Tax=Bionectria ochroleuca TaxID=29856 RepID=A0ABY6UL23_BIOOC|nr:unnamed protein product [Clonostachys rosea]
MNDAPIGDVITVQRPEGMRTRVPNPELIPDRLAEGPFSGTMPKSGKSRPIGSQSTVKLTEIPVVDLISDSEVENTQNEDKNDNRENRKPSDDSTRKKPCGIPANEKPEETPFPPSNTRRRRGILDRLRGGVTPKTRGGTGAQTSRASTGARTSLRGTGAQTPRASTGTRTSLGGTGARTTREGAVQKPPRDTLSTSRQGSRGSLDRLRRDVVPDPRGGSGSRNVRPPGGAPARNNVRPPGSAPAQNMRPPGGAPTRNVRPPGGAPAQNMRPTSGSPTQNVRPPGSAPAQNMRPTSGSPAQNMEPPVCTYSQTPRASIGARYSLGGTDARTSGESDGHRPQANATSAQEADGLCAKLHEGPFIKVQKFMLRESEACPGAFQALCQLLAGEPAVVDDHVPIRLSELKDFQRVLVKASRTKARFYGVFKTKNFLPGHIVSAMIGPEKVRKECTDYTKPASHQIHYQEERVQTNPRLILWDGTGMPLRSAKERQAMGFPAISPIHPLGGNLLAGTPGMHQPRGYKTNSLGGARFALSLEKCNLHLVYLLYEGRRVWICVSPDDKTILEDGIRNMLIKGCNIDKNATISDELIRQALFYFPFPLLKESEAKFTIIDQKPGDLVVVLPGTYYQAINMGFTKGEAVNYADKKWTPPSQSLQGSLRSDLIQKWVADELSSDSD